MLYDQRGSGRSGGTRGDTTIGLMHEDLTVMLQYVDPTVPTFCYAHALGASIVISYCQMYPEIEFQGIITTNAVINLPVQYTRIKILLVSTLRLMFPTLMVNLYPNYSLASKNNYHIKKLVEDHLLSTFFTVRTAHEIIKLINFIQPNSAK